MDKAPKHLVTALKRTLAEGMNKEGTDKTDNKAGESAGGLKRKRREGRFRRLIFLTLVPAIADSQSFEALQSDSVLLQMPLDTGYLTHFEGQALLYIIRHKDEEEKHSAYQAITILGIIITMLRTGSSESAMKDLPASST